MCGGRTLAAGESRERLSNQRPVFRSRDPSGPIRAQYSQKRCRDQTQQTWPAAINLMENQCSVSRMYKNFLIFTKKTCKNPKKIIKFFNILRCFGIMSVSSIETLFNTTLMVFFLEGK